MGASVPGATVVASTPSVLAAGRGELLAASAEAASEACQGSGGLALINLRLAPVMGSLNADKAAVYVSGDCVSALKPLAEQP